MVERTTLTLPKVPVEATENALRFIERNTRYILQQVKREGTSSASSTLVWRDVPLVRLP